MASDHHFLLVGNASYLNRGCEAIVRGTMAILRHEFGRDVRVTLGSYMPADVARRQAATESDPGIHHVRLGADRYSLAWVLSQLNRRLGLKTAGSQVPIARALRRSAAVLEVGGDNYSLDYGLPVEFLEMDRYILQRGTPLVLWGASVGPFDKDPVFAEVMHAHLRKLDGIFVRESLSRDYLARHAIDGSVYPVADPAFCMRPVQPPPERFPHSIRPGAVGLNLSPLMANYVTAGDQGRWFETCAAAVAEIVRRSDREVHLVPHVMMTGKVVNDDPGFLTRIAAEVEKSTGRRLPVWSGELSAAELKWGISQFTAFAGARMHSTIAALSSCVPTLSLAYSVKAKGINQDLFGSQKYCLPPARLTAGEISGAFLSLIDDAAEVRRQLQRVMPKTLERAYSAGSLLRKLLESRRC